MEWQAVAGVAGGRLIRERRRAKRIPVVEIRETLPDGADFKAVWFYVRENDVARLVTVHFLMGGDNSEPYYEAETVELLKEAQARAAAGDIAWLQRHRTGVCRRGCGLNG